MLDKERLLELNRKGEYSKINKIFTEEYTSIIKRFIFEKTNEEYEENTLSELLLVLETIDDGEYIEVCNILEDMYFNEDSSNVKLLNEQIDNFKKINNLLNVSNIN